MRFPSKELKVRLGFLFLLIVKLCEETEKLREEPPGKTEAGLDDLRNRQHGLDFVKTKTIH